jgi:salicylate hydroxylase
VIPLGEPDFDLVRPACNLWLGPKSHVVTYYVHNGAAVNLVAIVEADAWSNQSWVVPSNRDELLAAFKGWHPKLLALLERAQVVQKWGLFDCDPMPGWSKGAATLLGDAAHPMLPFLSQGAGMAIEDGYVLADALKAAADVPQALDYYESARRPRTTRVQLSARARGKVYHQQSAIGRFLRDLDNFVRGLINPYSAGMKTDWIYAHDATRSPFLTGGAA